MPPRDIWQSLSRRHARNPGRIPLNSLPPEILHEICRLLEGKEVRNFRLSCKLFSMVGSDYLLDEVHLIHKPSSYQRLCKIAEHPLADQVTALFFEADRLCSPEDVDSLEKWYLIMETFRPGIPRSHPNLESDLTYDEDQNLTDRSL